MVKNDFGKQLSMFLGQYLPHERNLSPNTISTYRDSFVSFLTYMRDVKRMKADRLMLKDVDKENVIGYLKWLTDAEMNNIATRNNRLAAFKSFAKYLQYNCVENIAQWQAILSIPSMKKEQTMPTHFTKEAVKTLLQQPDPSIPLEMKHLAILTLMYDTGCRVQELADLKVESLRLKHSPFSVKIYGKGRKTRIVPISKQAVDILNKYLACYHIDMEIDLHRYLFTNAHGSKLTRSGITYILKKYADMARQESPNLIPETVSCHQLRHGRAVHLLESGVNLVYIRDFLGHSSVQTTEIYARVDSKLKREAIEKASENLTPSEDIGEWVDNHDLISWLKGLGKN